jgi:S-formylglutathione hydrolase FrmB
MVAALALAAVLAGGSVQRFAMSAPALGEAHRDVRVYLPPSYFRPESRTARYPTVFLLHGWPGGDGNWFGLGRAAQTADSLIAAGRIPQLILVCPDGGGRGFMGRSLYVNSYDGTSRMEDYLVHDLVRWADSTFRTRRGPAAHAIAGLSDGGSGAVNLAFKHPEVFGGCASMSGDFVLPRPPGNGGVLGPEPGRSRIVADNSPARYAARVAGRLRGLTIYFDCGLADEALAGNRAFHQLLQNLGVPHTYHEFSGTHTWGYWRTHLRDALTALGAGWAPRR